MNSSNEILKRKFLSRLEHAEGYSSKSLLKYEKPIHHYQICFKDENFSQFNKYKAIAYKEHLKKAKYSEGTYRTYLHHIKKFFSWLATQVGYRRKIKLDDIEYFNITKKEKRTATQVELVIFPKHEEILKLINTMPNVTAIDKRNKALLAFIYCTGMRDDSVRTLPYSAVNLEKWIVTQNPKAGTDTKFGKIIYSKIFAFDEELVSDIKEWFEVLKKKKFKPSDPFFPKSKSQKMKNGLSYIESTEIDNKHWNSTVSIRKIFKHAAERADMEYFPPHSFRHSSIYRAIECIKDFKELKAISQNFGHESIVTILESYANFKPEFLLNILDGIDVKQPNQFVKQIPRELKQTISELIKKLLDDYYNNENS